MDVDFTQMHPDKKEQLMKAGKMFPLCEKQGTPLPRMPYPETKLQFAKLLSNPEAIEKAKKKPCQKNPPNPPPTNPYSKGINACTMEDRQKLLEVILPTREIVTTRIFR